MPSTPIKSPTNYAVSHAVAFADSEGSAQLVSAASPMPVNINNAAPLAVSVSNSTPMAVSVANPTTAPIAGTANANVVAGPFAPVMGRAVILSLSGTWVGAVKVTRSTDGGTSRLPLTIAGGAWANFTANCCEAVWEECDAAASLYLDITLTSGTVTYRLAQ
ncbi:MAG: hypothetical protein RLY97_648 [Pseudomonadota bacterium]